MPASRQNSIEIRASCRSYWLPVLSHARPPVSPTSVVSRDQIPFGRGVEAGHPSKALSQYQERGANDIITKSQAATKGRSWPAFFCLGTAQRLGTTRGHSYVTQRAIAERAPCIYEATMITQ